MVSEEWEKKLSCYNVHHSLGKFVFSAGTPRETHSLGKRRTLSQDLWKETQRMIPLEASCLARCVLYTIF